MTQPPNETPDLPEEAIGGVPTQAPESDGSAGDGGADGAAGDGGADGAAGDGGADGAAGDGGADGGAAPTERGL